MLKPQNPRIQPSRVLEVNVTTSSREQNSPRELDEGICLHLINNLSQISNELSEKSLLLNV